MEPTKLRAKHTDADAGVPDRVHGKHRSDNVEHMPQSVWAACVGFLGDVFKHLRQVAHKSYEPDKSGQPGEPHVCTRNPYRTCNCPAGACADDDATYRYARGPYGTVRTPEPNKLGDFRCPISGLACSKYACREWCESGVDYTKT